MRVLQRESTSQPSDIMADSVHYAPTNHYVPAPAYYAPPPPGHMHVVSAPPRQDTTQRKRPKYTRSKTGCLTCRAKKIKCDESKPNCMRCTHGQRECTWPEGVPTRKKAAPRKEQQPPQPLDSPLESPVLDTRPSTAGSSGISDTSTPPTRNHTPPRREPAEASIPPLISRRPTQAQVQLSSIPSDVDSARRQTSHDYSVHGSNGHMLPGIQMSSQYSSYQQHYAPTSQYGHGSSLPRISPQHDHASAIRPVEGSSHSGQWTAPSMIPHVDHIDPYFASNQDRALVGHSSQVRY